MEAIALKRIDDVAGHGSADAGLGDQGRRQAAAAAHRHLDQGADARASPSSSPNAATRSPATGSSACRREGEGIEVHVIGCDSLADGVDADWVDLAWGDQSDGGAARLAIVIKNQPGSLAVDRRHPRQPRRQHRHRWTRPRATARFHTFHLDIEVHDVQHLMRILAALAGDRRGLDGGAALAVYGWRLDPENLAVEVDDVEIAGLVDAEARDIVDRARIGREIGVWRRMNWLLGRVVPRLTRAIGIDQILPLTKSAKK